MFFGAKGEEPLYTCCCVLELPRCLEDDSDGHCCVAVQHMQLGVVQCLSSRIFTDPALVIKGISADS